MPFSNDLSFGDNSSPQATLLELNYIYLLCQTTALIVVYNIVMIISRLT